MNRIALRLGFLLLLLVSAVAHADVIFLLGTYPQPNEEAITFNVGDSGNTIHGLTSTTLLNVLLRSELDPLRVYALGPSFGIQTAHDDSNLDTSINDVSISLSSGTFQDLLGSIYGVFAENPVVTFSVWTTDSSTPFTWSFTGDLSNHGNVDNFFTIYATNNELITRVLIAGKFYELRDLEISGATQPITAEIPEPGSLTLMAGGLVTLARLARKKSLGLRPRKALFGR